MNHTLNFVAALLLTAPMAAGLFASDLYPVYSKVIANEQLIAPEYNLDTIYPLQNCDSTAEYYLGSGAANDTFFMVLEPLAACSVYYVEIQWNDSGNAMAFAADYSAAAEAMFPAGYAPSRGESPVSPIGAWFTGLYPEASSNPGNWELLNLGGSEWIVGNPMTNEPALFGVGFIKGGAQPHPLADDVTAWTDSIRTWFGGPWMPAHNYHYPWGGYSSGATKIEVMLRAWVSYPWGGNPNITISLIPVNPPIQIPPSGGSFNFTVEIANSVQSPQTFDAWISVQLPGGSWYGPVLGPANLTLPGQGTLTRVRTQNVPGSAPAGIYTYRGYVGDYPAKWDSSGFIFTKLAAGGSSPGSDNWANTGDEFEVGARRAVPAIGEGAARCAPTHLSCAPNPFNPKTVLSYQLPVASFVNLTVYDISGRSVATVVDGWREAGSHEATFDGSNLASGIYVYRLEAGNFSAVKKLILLK